ncbi:MAG: hypothetical protein ABEH88_02415 [Halobacteriales archaeon]
MVEDRITDGRRIAQLLASELDGRSDGSLESVAVTSADPDVEPTEAGARAYDVEIGGSTAATVFVHPERVQIETTIPEKRIDAAGSGGVQVERAPGTDEAVIVVEYGAAVKQAVDLLTYRHKYFNQITSGCKANPLDEFHTQ